MSAAEYVVHLDGLVVGPDQWLVLVTDRPLSLAQAQNIAARLPAALAGRVLVVDGMTGFVVDAADPR